LGREEQCESKAYRTPLGREPRLPKETPSWNNPAINPRARQSFNFRALHPGVITSDAPLPPPFAEFGIAALLKSDRVKPFLISESNRSGTRV
jgi:hypothetical protein